MKHSATTWEEKLEDLLSAKAFKELNDEERHLVLAHLSEEEYESMRQVDFHINRLKTETELEPSGKVWEQIRSRHTGTGISIMRWKVSGLAAGIALVVASGFAFYLGSDTSPLPNSTSLETTRVVHDTVFIPSPPDTVYLRQVVYRDKALSLPQTQTRPLTASQGEGGGVSMKEKEDLNALLVSGADDLD